MRDKILGVIFGTAIGDALGYPVEFQDVHPSKPLVHPDTLPHRYSDDTQMMRAVIEGMLRWSSNDVVVESLRFDKPPVVSAAEEVAEEFIAWADSPENNRSPGVACMRGCRKLKEGEVWNRCGHPVSGGCGTAMRSQAYGLFFPSEPEMAAYFAGEHALMTHGHPLAQASAAAVAAGVATAIREKTVGRVVKAMTEAADRWDTKTNAMLCEAAMASEESADSILDRWRGWAGHEAVAASLWCFLRHPDNFTKAVLLAVNSPGDSDSLGAITGALVGARVGLSGIPERWIKSVEDTVGLEALGFRVCERLGV